jgi:hypothetical protein
MGLYFVVVLVALFVLAAWWWGPAASAQFVVRIDDGAARLVRGKVAAAMLRQVEEICREHGVRRGEVYGRLWGRRRVRLAFSRGIPPACRQRLRNVWPIHG